VLDNLGLILDNLQNRVVLGHKAILVDSFHLQDFDTGRDQEETVEVRAVLWDILVRHLAIHHLGGQEQEYGPGE